MSDKKKLQEMLDKYKRYYLYHDFSAQFNESDIEWLLDQAERTQELQQENKYYKEQLDISRNMAADIIAGLQKELMKYKNKSNNK